MYIKTIIVLSKAKNQYNFQRNPKYKRKTDCCAQQAIIMHRRSTGLSISRKAYCVCMRDIMEQLRNRYNAY